ncbi:ABC transporter permease, partial [Enterococcus mundtii]|nr:ABC transporter permease [Enterococcus mundtii]
MSSKGCSVFHGRTIYRFRKRVVQSLSENADWYGYVQKQCLDFLIIIIVFAFIMKNTRLGRYTYVVGSNQEAARLSGIDTDKHIIKMFMIEGMLAAIAGLLIVSNLNGGASKDANGLDLFAMAAAIMGGTSFSGGIGTIGGAVAGILTLQVFKNGLTLMGVNSF